jgi:TrmH family RNA methyltransferase
MAAKASAKNMITSRQNPKIQMVRALISRRKTRYANNEFVLEGVRLIEEALSTGAVPQLVLYSQISERSEGLLDRIQQTEAEIEQVAPDLINWVSDTKTSQGFLAVFKIQPLPPPTEPDFVILLDSIRDPGNLGAILRTAAAAGVQMVILSPESTDPYAPKVVRAGMGAHFYLPIHTMDWNQIKKQLKSHAKPLRVFASDVKDGTSCWNSDLCQPLLLIIGSEATGISSQAEELSEDRLHIPMQGKIESLNASIAASILIFEIVRQRKS